jgi:hypothetical protein
VLCEGVTGSPISRIELLMIRQRELFFECHDFLRIQMKPSFRILTLILALLIAGREVLASGNFIRLSERASVSQMGDTSRDYWMLENEAEEEIDGNDEYSHSLSKSFCDLIKSLYHLVIDSSNFRALGYRYPGITIEFYIYVLNLRL